MKAVALPTGGPRPLKLNATGKMSGRKLGFVCLCTIPTTILFVMFVVLPIINLIQTSFTEWNGIDGEKTFVGFDNYAILFRSSNFWEAFRNTVFLIVVVTAVTIGLSLYFASVLARKGTKGKTFFRIVFYIPNILSIVVISAIVSAILSPGTGLVSVMYDWAGKVYTGWLANNRTVMWCIAAAMIWQAVGYYMVMYIAGMDSIPDSLYEAADLEGASSARQFFSITLPLTWEVIRTTLTFFIISTINMSFLFVDSMTQGQFGSHVLLTYMYQQAYTNSVYGYGMAIGVALFVFAYVLALIVQILTHREQVEY